MLTWAILLSYGFYRFYSLVTLNDYDILTEIQKDHFEESYAVGTLAGFNVAATVTSYGAIEEEEDPEIGTLEFYTKSWKDDLSPLVFTKLRTRKCTLADFDTVDLDEEYFEQAHDQDHEVEEATFYPIHKESVSYVGYIPSMKCIDEPFEIYGSFDTNIASNLMVTFE